MSDIDEFKEKVEVRDMGTIVLMLGLYLILLSFFILLNTMADVSEEKVQQTSQSVAQGFGFQRAGDMTMRDDVDMLATPVFEIVAREIQNVAESYISDTSFEIAINGSQMVLTIDSKKLFAPGSIRIRPAMAYFFEDMSKIISSKRAGSVLMTEIVIKNNETDIGGSQIPLRELAGRRSALFARALVERGVEPSSIHTSIEMTGETKVEIIFDVIVTDSKQASQPRSMPQMQTQQPAQQAN